MAFATRYVSPADIDVIIEVQIKAPFKIQLPKLTADDVPKDKSSMSQDPERNGKDESLRVLVADVAAAYFANSHVGVDDIPLVISQIASSLGSIGGSTPASPSQTMAEPNYDTRPRQPTAAQIRKSITPDALISFEDNKGYKTLKRHLTLRGLTPDQYREKWGLPRDYPMVSPNYSTARSQMAKSLGLGRKPGTKLNKTKSAGARP